ncbi:MAG: YcaO-like family protein [Vicinamibacteria bacterium]
MRSGLLAEAPSRYREALARARPAVSFRTGIVSDVQEKRLDADDPDLHVFASVLADAGQFSFQACSRFNAGAAVDRDEAMLKAIGEGLERYCAGLYDKSALVVARYAELGPDEAVSPARFALFSERQYASPGFPYRPASDDTPIAWVEGFSLTRRRPVLVPACLVFVPYQPVRPGGETTLAPSVSSGLACGPSVDQACLSGLCEVVERDAFCILWAHRLRLPRITVAPGRLDGILRQRFAPSGLRFELTSMALDLDLPNFVCVCSGDSAYGPLVSVGASCHLDPETALLKAVVESAHARLWMKQIIRSRPDWRPDADYANVRTFEDHVLAYRWPHVQAELDFLTDDARPVLSTDAVPCRATGHAARDLEACVALVARSGLEPIRVDVTTEDVAELGLHVVKTLVPGLQEINGRHDLRFLGGRRLYEVPERIGLPSRGSEDLDLNPAAHPFP